MNQFVSVVQENGEVRVATFDDLASLLDDIAEYVRQSYDYEIEEHGFSHFQCEMLDQAIAAKDAAGIASALDFIAAHTKFEWTFYHAEHGYNLDVLQLRT